MTSSNIPDVPFTAAAPDTDPAAAAPASSPADAAVLDPFGHLEVKATAGHASELLDGAPVPDPTVPLPGDYGISDRRAWRDVAARAVNSVWQAVGPRLQVAWAGGGAAAVWTWHLWATLALIAATAAITSAAKNIVAWKVLHVSPQSTRRTIVIGTAATALGTFAGYIVAAASVFDLTTFRWLDALTGTLGTTVLSLVWMYVAPAARRARRDADASADYRTNTVGRADGRHQAAA